MDRLNQQFFINNFNLLRLLAAFQVAHHHVVSIYNIEINSFHHSLIKFFNLFPGVPIFFFISGFLISRSWETSSSWKEYAIKRIGRIEPALIVSVLFAILLSWISGYLAFSNATIYDLGILLIAKTSILQVYNPDYLRAYGDGVLNGSLWTITVEIQFYILIPFIYFLFLRNYSFARLLTILLVFLCVNLLSDFWRNDYKDDIIYKLFNVSFLPWFFMFLTGVLFQKSFGLFYRLLHGRFLIVFCTYLLSSYFASHLGADFGNSINPILFFILACLIFSAAYTIPKLAQKILGDTDISYGIYLYHMPIINYLMYQGYDNDYSTSLLILATTIVTSIASWFLIEKPSLDVAKKINSKDK